jgi:hypothetical protein
LGTDGLIFTPAGGGGGLVTAPSVAGFPAAGEPGKVYLAEDSGDTFRFDATARGTDTYVRISESTLSTKIEDSTEIGRDLVTAVDEVSGRAAIAATDVRIDGVNVSAVEVDVTPLTAHDVGAYTFAEVDDAIEAAKNRPALIAPAVDQINDVNTKPVLVFPAAANAVNYLQIENAASGGGVSFLAKGSDANINASVFSKGTGEVALRGGSDLRRIISAIPVASGGVNQLYVSNATTGNPVVVGTIGEGAAGITFSMPGPLTCITDVRARRFIAGTRSTVTASGLLVLVVDSAQIQVFTGTAAFHRVALPTTLVTAGSQWRIINNSTGVVAVELPDVAKTRIDTIEAGESRTFIAQVDTPILPAHWGPHDVKGSVAGTPTALTLWTGTKAQYDSIGTKSATTIYVVTSVTAVTGDITSTEGQ